MLEFSIKGGENMNSYKVLGFVFLIVSGLIYTFERISSVLSTSLIKASFYAGKMTGEIPEVKYGNLFDNFFVPLFFLLSVILLVYGFKKSE
jgi:hypothetical protein